MRIAFAPSLTACAMRCAWTWPSSAGGVSQTISIGMPCFCDSSFAAASAPVRADRNTGLVELFAIIAILSGWRAGGARRLLPPALAAAVRRRRRRRTCRGSSACQRARRRRRACVRDHGG